MTKSLFLLPVLLFVCSLTFAQTYKSAIGARLGYPLAASFKTFVNEQSAFEFTAGTRGYGNRFNSYRYRWYSIGAAYQVHKPLEVNIDGLENLNYYFGGGASAYFWSWKYNSQFNESRYASTSFGVQGYIGLDYTFENLPLNISLDWVPTIFINGFGSGFGAGYGGIALRYIISE